MVLSLFVASYVVHRLGLRAFGFWAVVSAVSQYAQLLDFGVGPALTRYVAHFDEREEHGELHRRAASGLWGSVAFMACITALAAGIVLALPHSVVAGWPSGWQVAVVCNAAALGLASMSSVFQAFPNGMGRWDLSNVAQLAGQVTYSAVAVALLWHSESLAGLGVGALCGALVTCGVAYVSSRRLWPLGLSPRVATWRDAKEVWRYGTNVQLVNLVVLINAQADKPILLLFAPLSFVGLYELGSRVAYTIRTIPVTAFGPLIAASAREAASEDAGRLTAFYLRTYRIVLGLGVAPLIALYGASYALVIAWLGASYSTSGVIALVLGFGYTVNIATGAGTTVAMGAGRPDIDRNYSLLGFALNLALTVLLGVAIGRWGVIAATSLGLAVSSLWLIRSVDRWLSTDVLSLRGIAGSVATRALLAWGALVGVACAWLAIALPVHNRFSALLLGAAGILVFACAWLPGVMKLGILDVRGLWPGRATPADAAPQP